jgi:predicted DNA-binding transcriptional regulator AlpA
MVFTADKFPKVDAGNPGCAVAALSVPPLAGFYTLREVIALTSLSATTIWRATRDGEFPRSTKLTKGRVGFPKAAVDAWIAEKTAAVAAVEGA